jgi:hypothetical protein
MMDQNSTQQTPEESMPEPEKPPIFPWVALVLPFIAVICCSLVFLPHFFAEDRLFIYWRNFVAIGFAEAAFCLGGIASLAAVILGGVALAKGQKYKAASIVGIILGLLIGLSACLIMPIFLLVMFSSI